MNMNWSDTMCVKSLNDDTDLCACNNFYTSGHIYYLYIKHHFNRSLFIIICVWLQFLMSLGNQFWESAIVLKNKLNICKIKSMNDWVQLCYLQINVFHISITVCEALNIKLINIKHSQVSFYNSVKKVDSVIHFEIHLYIWHLTFDIFIAFIIYIYLTYLNKPFSGLSCSLFQRIYFILLKIYSFSNVLMLSYRGL